MGDNMGQKAFFIDTDPAGVAGEWGEWHVWKKLKEAYAEKECLAYLKYPIFSKERAYRYESDILLLDREYGAVVIEVKSYGIHNITNIQGHVWEHPETFYTQRSEPYNQAERQLRVIMELFDKYPDTKGKIKGKALIALPNITEAEWKSKYFDRLENMPPIIFKDQMGKAVLRRTIREAINIQGGVDMTDELFEKSKSVLSGMKKVREKMEQLRSTDYSRLQLINSMEARLTDFDYQQEQLAKVITPGPQRIRGIAGSGKTVILCQKAANMYIEKKDWQIAITCFSKSLLHELEAQVDYWLRLHSNGDHCYDEDAKKRLKIFHAWGGATREGFYSYVCSQNAGTCLKVNHIKEKNKEIKKENKKIEVYNKTAEVKKPLKKEISSQGDQIGYICKSLLEEKSEPKQLFDAILIDEGQDLLANDTLLFEGKQPFYWLAYQSLRPVDDEDAFNRRLIWAYDESQSLDNLRIPTSKELFGDDPRFARFVSGFHKGGIKKSEIMQKCYRTPGPILSAAHAIGMGLMREGGMLRGITTKEGWRNIGYEVLDGNFRIGEDITLYRPAINSPNMIASLSKEPVIQLETYDTEEHEIASLVKHLTENIKEDMLTLHKQILIVVLNKSYIPSLIKVLEQNGFNYYVASEAKKNHYSGYAKKPEKFWENNAITISTVQRAKGNEADVVYVLGAHTVATKEDDMNKRNQLFVALTRARGWVTLSGVEGEKTTPFYDEIRKVLACDGTYRFTYRRAAIQQIEDEED